MLVAYAIELFGVIQVMLPVMKSQWKFAANYPTIADFLFRFLVLLLTYVVGMVVPDLAPLLALIGSVCSTFNTFVIPSVCELTLAHSSIEGISWSCCLKNSLILLISLVGFCWGGAVSLIDMIENIT
jgi:hypothetical protein